MKTPTRKSAAALVAVALSIALLASCSSSDADDESSATTVAPTPAPAEQAQSADIADVATNISLELGRGETDSIDSAFDSDYVDHFTGETGTAALVDRVSEQAADYPDAKTNIYRVVSEGDLVFVHANQILEPGTLGFATADIYRFEDGLIVERWGGVQEVPETTASGNDMFSTESEPQLLNPDPNADVEVTKATVGALGAALVVDRDLEAWDRLVEPPYYQHSTNTPNGTEAVKEIWGQLLVDPDISVTMVNGLAEGDLSVSQNLIEGPDLNLRTFDISRVIDGKIVEHWDVVQSLG